MGNVGYMADDTDVPTIIKNLTYTTSRRAKREQVKEDLQPVGPIMDTLTYSPTEEKMKKDELTDEEEEIVDGK